ncbi:palmitoyltransferase [Achlya hypogyna]|uniref:Palmitoyltransferase n=1 Tax=Achlya hypogyna TaxID=1202772 RepID=A0A1V9Z4Z6_ACHHY|nr:palmitoyltransferase [Achlya hypogyna]
MCWCGCLKGLSPLMRLCLPTAIALLILWLYFGFLINPVGLRTLPLLHVVHFHVCVGLLGASLFRTMTAKVFARDSPLLAQLQDDNADIGGIEQKFHGGKRFCRKCALPKPDRTHHCSTCNACIAKMDHHCVFLNKCIGLENYKFFVLFLFWSAVSCLNEAALLYTFVVPTSLEQLGVDFIAGTLSFRSTDFQIVAIFFVALCVGIALSCFGLMHFYLAAFNMTTLEYCEKRDEIGYVNYYHVGTLANLRQVFGPPPVAFLPRHPAHMGELRMAFPSTKLKQL